MAEEMKITFWGVRGSYPVPGKRTMGFGGNTACVELRAGEQRIVFDAGTGAIGLGQAWMREFRQNRQAITATFLFSHLHHDHLQGFPFFSPAYMPTTTLHLIGTSLSGHTVREALTAEMQPPAFPLTLNDLQSTKRMIALSEREAVTLDEDGTPRVGMSVFTADDPQRVVIRCLRSSAHPGGVAIYRVNWRGLSVVYATDTEGYANMDQRLINFASGADLLIHDSQYLDDHYLGRRPGFPTTQGYGHSTVSMACELARAAGVRRLALFHYDPAYDDTTIEEMQTLAQTHFHGAFAPREEQEVCLPVPETEAISFPALALQAA